jgi:dihydroceramidase
MTPYVAEFVNTVTNLGYSTNPSTPPQDTALISIAVYLGVRGIKNSRKGGNDSVVNLCYSMLVFLGGGSAAYHLNIKHETQMRVSPLLLPQIPR